MRDGSQDLLLPHDVTVPSGPSRHRRDLGLKVDDGAVVYLDGVEVGRTNMPSGHRQLQDTGQLERQDGLGDDADLPPAALTVGSHTLAVEVHQYRAGSTADLYFDAMAQITR